MSMSVGMELPEADVIAPRAVGWVRVRAAEHSESSHLVVLCAKMIARSLRFVRCRGILRSVKETRRKTNENGSKSLTAKSLTWGGAGGRNGQIVY